MDQLPDLPSDADVDALMARVRAQLVGPSPSAPPAISMSERTGNALRDFLAVQEEYASLMSHALEVIGAALEDLDDVRENRRARRGRRIAADARRLKGRQRKTR